MNIIARLLNGPGPDPRAVAQGLTVIRLGWGRYRYTGRPAYAASWTRRPADDLDRVVCAAAGMLGARCPECRSWDADALTPTRCQLCIETPGWYRPAPAGVLDASTTPQAATSREDAATRPIDRYGTLDDREVA